MLLELHTRSLYGVGLHMHPIAQPYTSFFTVRVCFNNFVWRLGTTRKRKSFCCRCYFGVLTGGA